MKIKINKYLITEGFMGLMSQARELAIGNTENSTSDTPDTSDIPKPKLPDSSMQHIFMGQKASDNYNGLKHVREAKEAIGL